MQKELCLVFRKHWPFVEVGLIIDEKLFVDFIDTPMLNVPEGKTIKAIFTRATDMRGIDECFRGPRPTFEEDMTREAPASE